ncbi:MAG TPA: PQQ-binding-like beta-propeller repeat protein [Ktedonobacteraceae bacterium]|nr:PQQ-binding-like beta-propeller repeat protein [Ktedonobacteraceae bacterium]
MATHGRAKKLVTIVVLCGLLTILFSSWGSADKDKAPQEAHSDRSTAIGQRAVAPTPVFPTTRQGAEPALVPISPHKPIDPLQPAPDDWPSYLLDNGGFNANEVDIAPATAPFLQLLWSYHAQGAISAQPVEVNGRLYWGSWDGLEHAMDMQGHQLWATNLGTTTDDDCDPPEAGVAGTATVSPMTIQGQRLLALFVGGGNGTFYALNASNGRVLWQTALGQPPDAFIWSSPVLYRGSIYEGLSSFGDCPLVQGKLFRLDAATGEIQNVFNTVPDGCIGGSIWGSPVIDTRANTVYFTTGNPSTEPCPAGEPFAPALVELRVPDLSLVSFWQVPQSQWSDDSDFGSTPTLFTAHVNGKIQNMVGAINKNGIFYAFVREQLGNGPVWSDQIATSEGSMSPGAWDGNTLYIGGTNTQIHGQDCPGSLRAVDPATGTYRWERCLMNNRVMGPVTAVYGVVVVGEGQTITVLDAATGKALFGYTDTHNDSAFWSAATISHGFITVGNMDGNFYAFGLVVPSHGRKP